MSAEPANTTRPGERAADTEDGALEDAAIENTAIDDAVILEHIFEESPLPIAIYDERGNVRRRNDAHASFIAALGAAAGLGDFNVLSDARAKDAGHAHQFARAYQGATLEYRFSCTRGQESGAAPLHFLHLLMPMRTTAGKVASVVGIIADVTQQEEAAQEHLRFQQRLAQLQKLESLGLLAGGIAHDFNNLLVAVMGNASYLLRKLDPESPFRSRVSAIETAARRAADVAQQMLVYAGRGSAAFQHVDVGELVSEIAELLRVSISQQAELRVKAEPGAVLVKGDGTQLRQVVMNLITNASDAFAGRRGHIEVRTGWFQPSPGYLERCLGAPDPAAEGFAYIQVQDDGCGMAPDVVARAFDPFFTTKLSGRGLGLSAVLGIIRRHRAALRVESREGAGTCMTILLPSAGPASSVARPRESAALRALPRGLSALVVDNDAPVREVTRSLLEELGCVVHTAPSSEGALELCARHASELSFVLMDVTMPAPDGVATSQILRTRHPELPIIFMSGLGPPTLREMHAFLAKPFTLQDLQAAVASTLALHHD